MPNYKVNDGYRVAHGEGDYKGGDTVEMTKEEAEPLLEHGAISAARSAAAHKPEAKAEDKSGG